MGKIVKAKPGDPDWIENPFPDKPWRGKPFHLRRGGQKPLSERDYSTDKSWSAGMAAMRRKPQCGAKTRITGFPCRDQSTMPNGRCRRHGGRISFSENARAATRGHGVYRRSLTTKEFEWASKAGKGNLEEELKLCRVQLKRATELQLKSEEEKLDTMEVDEVRAMPDKHGKLKPRLVIKKRKDYAKIIEVLTGRIVSIERALAAMDAGVSDAGQVESFADRLIGVMDARRKGSL